MFQHAVVAWCWNALAWCLGTLLLFQASCFLRMCCLPAVLHACASDLMEVRWPTCWYHEHVISSCGDAMFVQCGHCHGSPLEGPHPSCPRYLPV
jgi:hypothetical protein